MNSPQDSHTFMQGLQELPNYISSFIKRAEAKPSASTRMYEHRDAILGTDDVAYVLSVENAASRKFRALLIASIIILIAAGAVFAALYAPQHMPDALTAVINGLSPVALQGLFMGAAAGATLGVTGLAAAAIVKAPSIKLDKLSLFSINTAERNTSSAPPSVLDDNDSINDSINDIGYTGGATHVMRSSLSS